MLRWGVIGVMAATVFGTIAYAQTDHVFDSIVCPFKGEVSYEPGEIECGLLAVPENRSDPSSRKIELHFVKIRAEQEDDKRNDPVILLAGGPGAQVTAFFVKSMKDHGVVRYRDLYILEQRGVGISGDFCPHFSKRNIAAYGTAETFAEFELNKLRRLQDCFKRALAAGVDLDAYNTDENARDVRALREALGFAEWNVWGVSYGSLLGQTVLRVDPDGVRAVVLDSIVPISSEDMLRVGRSYRRDFNLLLDACQDQQICGNSFPNLESKFMDAIRAVESAPLLFEAKDTEFFPSGEGRIFHDLVAGLPFFLFYSQDGYPALPAVIDALSRAALERQAEAFKALTLLFAELGGASEGMARAVFCRDAPYDQAITQLSSDLEEEPLLGVALSDLIIWRACRDTGLTPFDASHFEMVQTTTPAVIANGAWDPITPPSLAEKIVPGFSNGTYIEFPYSGHVPTVLAECAGEFLTSFFDNPTSPVDRSCADQMEMPKFWGPLFETSAFRRAVIMVLEDRKTLIMRAAPLGGSLLVLAFAFVMMPLSAAARWIDGTDGQNTGGARLLGWIGAAAGLSFAGGLAYMTYLTVDTTPVALLFGVIGWARYVTYLVPAAIVLGLTTLFLTVKACTVKRLPIDVLLGLIVTGAAAIVFGAAAFRWDLGPF